MVEAPAAVEDALASLLVHPDQSLQARPTPPDLLCRQHCRFATALPTELHLPCNFAMYN